MQQEQIPYRRVHCRLVLVLTFLRQYGHFTFIGPDFPQTSLTPVIRLSDQLLSSVPISSSHAVTGSPDGSTDSTDSFSIIINQTSFGMNSLARTSQSACSHTRMKQCFRKTPSSLKGLQSKQCLSQVQSCNSGLLRFLSACISQWSLRPSRGRSTG